MIYVITTLLLISVLVNVFLILALKRSFYQIDILESWILEFRDLLKNTYKKLKSIDERGMFEKDDDVGIIFEDIVNIITLTNKRIQTNNDETENLKKEN